jgi:hypothetical protein
VISDLTLHVFDFKNQNVLQVSHVANLSQQAQQEEKEKLSGSVSAFMSKMNDPQTASSADEYLDPLSDFLTTGPGCHHPASRRCCFVAGDL